MSNIREAENADEGAVYDLAAKFSSQVHIDRAIFHNIWIGKMKSENSYACVAEVENSIVGYISGYRHTTLYSDKPIAWIDEIFVREDMRKCGIGRSLMDQFARWATNLGCRLITLSSRDGGEFYSTLGYREDASKYYKRDIPE